MTSVRSSVGVLDPPASNTALALADSVVAWFGLPFGSSVLMPPIATLNTNRPMVAMNHPANTGQRWRELHIATRTVAGSWLPGRFAETADMVTDSWVRALRDGRWRRPSTP